MWSKKAGKPAREDETAFKECGVPGTSQVPPCSQRRNLERLLVSGGGRKLAKSHIPVTPSGGSAATWGAAEAFILGGGGVGASKVCPWWMGVGFCSL